MASLQFARDGKRVFVHLLKPGRTIIGRSDRCDVALPSDSLSRTHCIVEKRGDEWWVTDRSRNGTLINGDKIDKRRVISGGEELGIGDYTAKLVLSRPTDGDATTATMTAVPAPHEELVEVTPDTIATNRAQLTFTAGTREGESFLLRRTVTTLGGHGADLVLDPDLPVRALIVRCVRGRVMVEPAEAPASLAGLRVRSITPALPGEELRIGEHRAIITVHTEAEPAPERSSFGLMVGKAASTRKLFGVLGRMAAHDMPVLLCGHCAHLRKKCAA